MAEVLLFHHALGQTPGFLRRGAPFDRAHRAHPRPVRRTHLRHRRTRCWLRREDGLRRVHGKRSQSRRRIARRSGVCRFLARGDAGSEFAQNRQGAAGALFFHSCVPTPEFGSSWPAEVPVQIHAMGADPLFVEDGDIDAARELAESAPQAELLLYPGDQHLFADSGLPSFDPSAAELLRRRVLDFLATR